MKIDNLDKENLEYIEKELTEDLNNFNRFKDLLLNKNVQGIDINKAKIKITKNILDYCNTNNYKIINNFIFLNENNIPVKTQEQLEIERLENLKKELRKTEIKFFELNKEINKMEIKNFKGLEYAN